MYEFDLYINIFAQNIKMIIVTGAAGFIGSCLVGKLNAEGYNDIVLVDHFTDEEKQDLVEFLKTL